MSVWTFEITSYNKEKKGVIVSIFKNGNLAATRKYEATDFVTITQRVQGDVNQFIAEKTLENELDDRVGIRTDLTP